jgi:hypothetical protein
MPMHHKFSNDDGANQSDEGKYGQIMRHLLKNEKIVSAMQEYCKS